MTALTLPGRRSGARPFQAYPSDGWPAGNLGGGPVCGPGDWAGGPGGWDNWGERPACPRRARPGWARTRRLAGHDGGRPDGPAASSRGGRPRRSKPSPAPPRLPRPPACGRPLPSSVCCRSPWPARTHGTGHRRRPEAPGPARTEPLAGRRACPGVARGRPGRGARNSAPGRAARRRKRRRSGHPRTPQLPEEGGTPGLAAGSVTGSSTRSSSHKALSNNRLPGRRY